MTDPNQPRYIPLDEWRRPQSSEAQPMGVPDTGIEHVSDDKSPWPNIVLGAAALALAASVVAYVATDRSPESDYSAGYNNPTAPASQEAPSSPAVSESSSPSAAPTPEKANPAEFKPKPLGCIATSNVQIEMLNPVSWYGIFQKNGQMYKTHRNQFAGYIEGAATIKTCLTDKTAVSYDSALSEQDGIATFTVDTEAMRFTFNPESSLVNNVKEYKKRDVFRSINKLYKQLYTGKAKPVDAKRLIELVSSGRAVVRKVGKYFLRNDLNRGKSHDTIIAQGQVGVQSAYQAQAAKDGFTEADIRFISVNDAAVDALTFAGGKTLPDLKRDRFKVHKHKRTSIFTITQEPAA